MLNSCLHLVARLNQPEGGLGCEVRGHDGVSGAPLDLVVLGAADDDSVCHHGDEAVDVGAKVDLDHVAVLLSSYIMLRYLRLTKPLLKS